MGAVGLRAPLGNALGLEAMGELANTGVVSACWSLGLAGRGGAPFDCDSPL